MAKNLSTIAELLATARQIDADHRKLAADARALEKRKKALNAQILDALGKSEEGSVDGTVVLRKKYRVTKTVTAADVREVCPELESKLIKRNTSTSIEWL